MDREQAYLMINRYLSGEATANEKQLLEKWVQESDENNQLFTELSTIWKTTGNLRLDLRFDTDKAWQQIAGQALTGQKRKSIFASSMFRIAASLLVLITVGTLLFVLSGSEETFHQTTANIQKHIVLPDNSQVWLNQNSTLSYSGNFNKNRILHLSGEAYFEVIRDTSRPFMVETSEMLTTVLGTSFNVVAGDGEPHQVMVTTGKVKVSAHNQNDEPVFLEPGTKVTYYHHQGKLQKSSIQDINFLAWKERKLQFRNTPLSQIEEILERYFNVQLSLGNDQLGNCQFTSAFEDPTIDEVLEELTMAMDIEYFHQDGIYLLEGTGCQEIDQ